MALKLDFSKVLVKDNTNRTTKAESDILQQAELIMARVTNETFNAVANTVASHTASISLQAEQIALKVASTDFNGNTIASLINQSAEEVKIQASKITLEGLITANGNFKVLADGSIEAVNAKLSGAITATRMNAPSNPAFYSEIGTTGGLVGLGLFDTRYGSEAFFEILESSNGAGFFVRDYLNRTRIAMTDAYSSIYHKDSTRFNSNDAGTFIYGANSLTGIEIENGTVKIKVNGVTKASW